MMQMKPEELRQLRAWAIEKSLDKHALEQRKEGDVILTSQVIADARKLVNFVRANP